MSNPELDKLDVEKNQPTITLELDVNSVNTILAALGELPHRIADPILRKVVEQAQKQVN